jgi:preprotein translocase subunit SecA
MIESALERSVRTFLADAERPEEFDREGLRTQLALQYLVPVDPLADAAATADVEAMVEAAVTAGTEALERKLGYLRDFGAKLNIPNVEDQVLSQVMLQVIDDKWKDHLYDLDQLRNAIQYRAYGQKDPLVEYKREAYEMFEDLLRDLQATFAERFIKVQVTAEPPRRPPPPPPPPADDLFPGETAPRAARAPAPPPVVGGGARTAGQAIGAMPEVGRNDPCPCGSGRKYKKCHGANR